MIPTVIGCGGVGGRAAAALAALKETEEIRLLDGDIFEERNADRQLGVVPGKPKVEALKDFLLERRPDLKIRTCFGFVGTQAADDVLEEWMNEGDPTSIVMTVDNFAARRKILERFYSEIWPKAQFLAAGGNELWDGHALAQLPSWDGTPAGYTTVYPDTLTRKDAFDPAKPSCTELAIEAEPQLATTNAMVAQMITQLVIFYELKLTPEVAEAPTPLLPFEHWLASGSLTTSYTNVAGETPTMR